MSLPARILAMLLAIALAGALGWRQGIKRTEAAYAAAAAEANTEARRLEIKRAGLAQGVTDAYVEAKNKSSAVAAAARDELARVRHALDRRSAASDAEAGCRADGERVAVLERLLREGAGLVEEGGRRVGALDAKASALQAYVGGVCLTVAP